METKLKPVFVYIHGNHIMTPDYDDIAAQKQRCESLTDTQPFIIISNSQNPGSGDKLHLNDVVKELNKYFGEGKIYEGRDVSILLNTHGSFVKRADGSGYDYMHTLNCNPVMALRADHTHADHTYETLLKNCVTKGNAKGATINIFDGSCYSANGMPHITRVIDKLKKSGELINGAVNFIADSRIFETSASEDTKSFLLELPNLAKAGIHYTFENLKYTYLTTMNNISGYYDYYSNSGSSPVLDKTFDIKSFSLPKELATMRYSDSYSKIEFLKENIKNPDFIHLIKKSILSTIGDVVHGKENGISYYENIISAMQKKDYNFEAQQNLGQVVAVADIYYNLKHKNPENRTFLDEFEHYKSYHDDFVSIEHIKKYFHHFSRGKTFVDFSFGKDLKNFNVDDVVTNIDKYASILKGEYELFSKMLLKLPKRAREYVTADCDSWVGVYNCKEAAPFLKKIIDTFSQDCPEELFRKLDVWLPKMVEIGANPQDALNNISKNLYKENIDCSIKAFFTGNIKVLSESELRNINKIPAATLTQGKKRPLLLGNLQLEIGADRFN